MKKSKFINFVKEEHETILLVTMCSVTAYIVGIAVGKPNIKDVLTMQSEGMMIAWQYAKKNGLEALDKLCFNMIK